jgi:hypothetical protein
VKYSSRAFFFLLLVKFFHPVTAVCSIAALFLVATRLTGATESEVLSQTLQTTRIRDQLTIYAGSNFLTLSETIVLTPLKVAKERERPGASSIVNILVTPLWIRDGSGQRPAFNIMRPLLNLTHGRVRRFTLVNPDGDTVRSIADMTPECRYVLTLEFGHVIPDRFTVTVNMSTGGIRPDTELHYTPSNDGQPVRSGPPESFYTELRVNADGSLESWQVAQGDKLLPRASSVTVRMERDLSHTIRFGIRAN